MPQSTFSGWTDKEIFAHAQDRLKFDHYAGVLADIICEADTPLTLGVFGQWGAGKTSLLRLIKDTLDTERASKFKTVWFNAWTFDKEDALWRALILLVLKSLRDELKDAPREKQKKLDDLEASLYRDVDREDLGGVTVDWEKAGVTAASGFARLSLSLVPGVGSLLADAISKTTEKVTGEKLDTLFDAVQREKRQLHREHIESLEQFQRGFAELLKDHFVTKDRRLVVFIDDLDRCLPDKAISVLEAIKLFLDAPGCVYVIGADQSVIEQGIRVKYGDSLPITGGAYLEKIIQIPFHLPPIQDDRIRDFIAQYDESVPKDCAAIMAAGIEPNPRKVKRTINIFRLLRKLAEKRAAEKEMAQFEAGLLAKIVVIQSRWRDLYTDLIDYPNLIQDLEKHFRKEEGEKGRQGEGETGSAEAGKYGGVGVGGGERETLVAKHATSRALGRMLILPPFFEPLKIEQVQEYLYLTHTIVAEKGEEAEAAVDAKRWDDLLSNDETKIKAAASAVAKDDQIEPYAKRLANVLKTGKDYTVHQRVSAGNALGYLGDIRFRPDAWMLPDEPMLGFVEIPAGPFLMGSDPKRDPNASEYEQPQHEVTLPAYYIARYPVTVAQFKTFVEASGYKFDRQNSLEGWPNHPVVTVTWPDALAFCDWLTETLRKWQGTPNTLAALLRDKGWRVTLPSEAEWEKAARGGPPYIPPASRGGQEGGDVGGAIYPWGDEFDPGKANTDESGINTTSPIGCFADGASPYGVLDMSGNVWEWTRSLWGKGDNPDFKFPYDPKDLRREDLKAARDVLRAVRGGSWGHYQRNCRAAHRSWFDPADFYYSVGFRVALSPVGS